jgi:hypothetical protein
MALLIISLSLTGLAACDTTDHVNKPRTMIIGGVPVHEQDYKLPHPSNENTVQGE